MAYSVKRRISYKWKTSKINPLALTQIRPIVWPMSAKRKDISTNNQIAASIKPTTQERWHSLQYLIAFLKFHLIFSWRTRTNGFKPGKKITNGENQNPWEIGRGRTSDEDVRAAVLAVIDEEIGVRSVGSRVLTGVRVGRSLRHLSLPAPAWYWTEYKPPSPTYQVEKQDSN